MLSVGDDGQTADFVRRNELAIGLANSSRTRLTIQSHLILPTTTEAVYIITASQPTDDSLTSRECDEGLHTIRNEAERSARDEAISPVFMCAAIMY